jgi:hypothetical protein
MRLIENKTTTREEWLVNCTNDLRENLFKDKGHEIPTDVKVSCGFPSRNAREGKKQAVGVCHPRSHSKDNVNEIFLNPCEDDSIEVLGTLVHELVHAIDDCKNGHKKAFRDIAVSVGLTGKMTSTTSTPELNVVLNGLILKYGQYPHAKIDTSNRKKQSTRNIKIECLCCDFSFRTSQKNIDLMTNYTCNACGNETLAQA